jgi:hypothetical protein
MRQLVEFAQLAADFAGRAHFAVVYVEEAHPTDGWVVPHGAFAFAQPATLDDRLAAARVLAGELATLYPGAYGSGCIRDGDLPHVLVDGMANAAATAFGALPERLAICVDGELAFLGGCGPHAYSIPCCREALEALVAARVEARRE